MTGSKSCRYIAAVGRHKAVSRLTTAGPRLHAGVRVYPILKHIKKIDSFDFSLQLLSRFCSVRNWLGQLGYLALRTVRLHKVLRMRSPSVYASEKITWDC